MSMDFMGAWLLDTFMVTSTLMLMVLLVRRPVARYFGPSVAYTLVYTGCPRFDALAGWCARIRTGERDSVAGQCAGRNPRGYIRAGKYGLRNQPNGRGAIGRLCCAWFDIMAWRRSVDFHHTDDPLRLYARRAFV